MVVAGGGEKRSDWDKGWRHSGHREVECFRVRMMHVWQKMWAHDVMMRLDGGERQIGQSMSSLSCRSITSFFKSSGLFDASSKL